MKKGLLKRASSQATQYLLYASSVISSLVASSLSKRRTVLICSRRIDIGEAVIPFEGYGDLSPKSVRR